MWWLWRENIPTVKQPFGAHGGGERTRRLTNGEPLYLPFRKRVSIEMITRPWFTYSFYVYFYDKGTMIEYVNIIVSLIECKANVPVDLKFRWCWVQSKLLWRTLGFATQRNKPTYWFFNNDKWKNKKPVKNAIVDSKYGWTLSSISLTKNRNYYQKLRLSTVQPMADAWPRNNT